MAWNYKRTEGEFAPLPEGIYRIRVTSAEMKKSKTGKDMISFEFAVSGKRNRLFHNIVFLPDKPEITNRQLTSFFDAFPGISDGDLNPAHWAGKVGAAKVRHRTSEYNGETRTRAEIHYFIRADAAAGLPAWVEPPKDEAAAKPGLESLPVGGDGFVHVPDSFETELLPF